jgi:hypothetical protein
MKTVFDLVATFCVVKREQEGAKPQLSYRDVVLDKDLTPSQCCAGKTVFEVCVKRLAKPHIKTEGLERVWLHDWQLRERQINEAKAA